MLTFKENQYKQFVRIKLNNFIKNQIDNLREKQFLKVNNYTDSQLYKILNKIIEFGMAYNIESGIELEYLINLFIKYSIEIETIYFNESVMEVFNYPDRKSSDILYNLHNLLEFDNNI